MKTASVLIDRLYKLLFFVGTSSGCHQMPERSFFIRGRQFPVCARCTGVLIGYITGIILHIIIGTYLMFCLAGCAAMFLDWFLQYLGIRPSTNMRRLFTGILGGYGIMGIQILMFLLIKDCFTDIFFS